MIRRILGISLDTVISVSGCGKKNSPASGSGVALVPSLKLSSAVAALTSSDEAYSLVDSILRDPGTYLTTGAATASGLTSLQYDFGDIAICETMNTTGTAYDSPANCLTLLANGGAMAADFPQAASPDYVAEIAKAHTVTAGYIDLMDATSRAKLGNSISLTTAHAHTYNWAYLNWAHPIKLTATITSGTTEQFDV